MAKASFTLVFFLFATLLGCVSAHPLERRGITEFKEHLSEVSHSIVMFDHQVSYLEAVSPVFPAVALVGLKAISEGFGECADDLLLLQGVNYIPDSDSTEILQQLQAMAPTFVSSMNRMAATYQKPQGIVKRGAGKALRDVGDTLNSIGNHLRRTVNDLGALQNDRQRAAYKQVGNQMLAAVQNASPPSQ